MTKNPFVNIPRNSLHLNGLVNWDNFKPSEITYFRYCCTQEEFPMKTDRQGTVRDHSTLELKVCYNPGQ